MWFEAKAGPGRPERPIGGPPEVLRRVWDRVWGAWEALERLCGRVFETHLFLAAFGLLGSPEKLKKRDALLR